MTKPRILTTFLCLLALGASAQVPQERVPAEDARAIRLTLDDAVKASAAANLGVSIQEYQYLESRQRARGSESIFDWYTDAPSARLHRRRP